MDAVGEARSDKSGSRTPARQPDKMCDASVEVRWISCPVLTWKVNGPVMPLAYLMGLERMH